MATRRRRPTEQALNGTRSSIPAQEDEADILEEVGGERDEGGELLVDAEAVHDVGAVDAESVRENRRMGAVVKKKRGGEKHILFNTDDLLAKYEVTIKEWPPNTLDITVTRLTGTPVMRTITSRPRSGVELYEAIKDIHGQHEEATYRVKFLDTNQKQYRGTGQITMPDTRPAGQQGQPMQYGNGAPPPQGYVPIQAQPYGYPSQAPAPHPTTAQPPTVQATDPIVMMRQMFEMFQTMSQRTAPTPAMPSMPQPQVMPTDPVAMMRQMFEMFQQTQGTATPLPAPQPVVVAAPVAPQPSIDPMAMMKQMFEMFRDMQASLTPRPSPMQRSAYSPQGDRDDPRPPYARPAYGGGQHQPPPQREKTMTETFRESMGVIRSAADMLQEMEGLLPSREVQESHASPEDDDSPFRVIDTGAAKLVVNKTDGSTRIWETGLANMPEIFKWVGEQRKEIQNEARQRRQQQQQPPQRLPPGYVEVGPGFQPPPGFRAVPVVEEDLPPPPEDVPPPIQEPPPVRQAWGAPTIPDEQEQ